MQIDLRTVNITPKRNAFDHLVRRFGDKQASRYQEATYDVQATDNLQYRPTWDPSREIFDVRRTEIKMADWYAFKDPRQYYYAAYTMARARQQESAESNFSFVGNRNLIDTVPAGLHQAAQELLVPLRHVAWGENMANSGMCADGYGTAITQACIYQAMDQLGIAQYLTRIGLELGDADALVDARDQWLKAERWQGLRKFIETSLVSEDWFRLYVYQNVVLDGLLYPLVYQEIIDKHFAANGGAPVAMLTSFMTDWYKDATRWTDSVMKIAAAESEENRALLKSWLNEALEQVVPALRPIAVHCVGADGETMLASVEDGFRSRMAKLKVEV